MLSKIQILSGIENFFDPKIVNEQDRIELRASIWELYHNKALDHDILEAIIAQDNDYFLDPENDHDTRGIMRNIIDAGLDLGLETDCSNLIGQFIKIQDHGYAEQLQTFDFILPGIFNRTDSEFDASERLQENLKYFGEEKWYNRNVLVKKLVLAKTEEYLNWNRLVALTDFYLQEEDCLLKKSPLLDLNIYGIILSQCNYSEKSEGSDNNPTRGRRYAATRSSSKT